MSKMAYYFVLLYQQYYGIWMEFTKGSSSFGMGGGVASFIGGLSSSGARGSLTLESGDASTTDLWLRMETVDQIPWGWLYCGWWWHGNRFDKSLITNTGVIGPCDTVGVGLIRSQCGGWVVFWWVWWSVILVRSIQTTINRRWFAQVERGMIAIRIPLGSLMLSDKQFDWSQRRFNTIR